MNRDVPTIQTRGGVLYVELEVSGQCLRVELAADTIARLDPDSSAQFTVSTYWQQIASAAIRKFEFYPSNPIILTAEDLGLIEPCLTAACIA